MVEKDKKIVIGIAGEMASGKETVTKYLVRRHDAKKYRMSSIISDILKRLNLSITRKNLSTLSFNLRKAFGQDIFTHTLIQDIEDGKNKIIVIDGIRRIAELRHLKTLDNFKFIYLKANLRNRYERLIQRNEKDDDMLKTFGEFKKDHEIETEKTILELKNEADIIITNDGELKDLYKKVDDIMKTLKM